jgi:drug/metabolite transporter (DMT)-like permease
MIKLSKGAGYMLISLTAFSLMHLLVKFIPHIPVSEIIFFRSLIAIVLSYAMVRQEGVALWGNRRGLLVIRGLAGVMSLLAFFYAIHHMPLATVVTITNLVPFFAMMLSVYFIGERISWLQWLLVIIAFIGVYMIKGFDVRVQTPYLIVTVFAAFFTALAHFMVRRLRDSEAQSVIIFYFPFVSIPVVVGPMLYYWVTPNACDLLVLLGIGGISQVGQIFLTRAYRYEEIGDIAGLYYVGLLLALGYGYFFFDETFNTMTIVGMLLVLSGAVFSVVKKT